MCFWITQTKIYILQSSMNPKSPFRPLGEADLSCLVLIFCSSCLFLPLSSDRFFLSANSSLSRRSSMEVSLCRAFSRSSISRNFNSQAWSQWRSTPRSHVWYQIGPFKSLRHKIWLPYLQLLLQLPFLLSIYRDAQVLGGVHCRVYGADHFRVNWLFHHVPFVWGE